MIIINKYISGLQLMVVGMGTVLITLYLLSLFLRITGSLLGPEKSPEKGVQESGEAGRISKTEPGKEGEVRKKAAVAAAIYSYLEETDDGDYKVISIRRNKEYRQNW